MLQVTYRVDTHTSLKNIVSCFSSQYVFTFYVSHRWRKMYCGHARLCVCLSAAVHPHFCTDPDETWVRGRGCPLVVHYWVDLQSVNWLHCYGNITRTLVYSVVWALLIGDRRVMLGVLNIPAAAWTAGFQWWHSGDITRMQNVSEYMLVLALCLVLSSTGQETKPWGMQSSIFLCLS